MIDAYNQTYEFLATLLERLDAGEDFCKSLLPFFDGHYWVPIAPGTCPSCDELFSLSRQSGNGVFCGLRGHGLKNNFFNLVFTSDELQIVVSAPFGNLQDTEAETVAEKENLRSLIAALVLVFKLYRERKKAFHSDESTSLCLCSRGLETSFQIRKEDDVIREGDSWQPLFDMAERALNPEDAPEPLRFYV